MTSKSITTATLPEDAIRTRAYLLWEADGRPFGQDDHYWGRALEETVAPTTSERAAAGARPVPEKRAKAGKAAKPPVANGKNSKA